MKTRRPASCAMIFGTSKIILFPLLKVYKEFIPPYAVFGKSEDYLAVDLKIGPDKA